MKTCLSLHTIALAALVAGFLAASGQSFAADMEKIQVPITSGHFNI
jgi:hypothetical protein